MAILEFLFSKSNEFGACFFSMKNPLYKSKLGKKSPVKKLLVKTQGQSEPIATNALVDYFIHWMGCIFSFGAGWGSSQSISFCC
jgi:hypothetical protein